uniref:Matrin-type domain-containing protein n=1 Tax=Amphiprion ocellaris TaxID=80972 RepID=A0AAQ5YAE1_AMPOC
MFFFFFSADNKRRKQLIGPEAKKPRCQSPGVEFVVPKSGFFCELCSVFYLNEISAKETHCSSQRHYHNLEVLTKKRPSKELQTKCRVSA